MARASQPGGEDGARRGGAPVPQARFSPTRQRVRLRIQPTRAMRALKRTPERESWAK